jgi:hypothetical protein
MKLVYAPWYMKNVTGLFSKGPGKQKGFRAQYAVFWIFLRDEKDLQNDVLINHELIHHEQTKELTPFLFFPLYLGNYLINLFRFNFDTDMAYRNIAFEKEAYLNEGNHAYRSKRKRYAWFKLF